MEAAKFKPGNNANPTGANQHKRTARSKSTEPSTRDHAAESANSAAGKIAEATGASLYSVKQLLALNKAAESGDQSAKDGMEAKQFKPGACPNPTGANQHKRMARPKSGEPSTRDHKAEPRRKHGRRCHCRRPGDLVA